jgi:beta-barrel assembly-enhancing protease
LTSVRNWGKFKGLFLISCFFTAFNHISNAQFEENYEPIQINSPLPKEYFSDIPTRAKELANLQQTLDKPVAEKLYTGTLEWIRYLFINGYILYGDPLTAYVNQVAQKAFEKNPEALEGIRIYVCRQPYANAYTYPDGTILVYEGLLGLLESEAQLAFILAHEIGHFNKKHTIDSYKKKLTLAENKEDTEADKIAFLSLTYSRENESEADAYALNIIRNSDYNAYQGIPALACLNKEDTSLVSSIGEYRELFDSENFQTDQAWFSTKKIFSTYKHDEKKINKSVFRGDIDNFSTHPSMEKRITAIQEILASTDYTGDSKKMNIVANDFEKIHDQAMFEMTETAYNQGEYFLSLCISSELIKKYPNNQYLLTNILKNTYWLAYYKDVNSLDHLEKDMPIFLRGRHWLTSNLFNTMSASDAKKMAYGFAKKYQKIMEKNDEFYFYLALSVDQFLGKETAVYFYDQYQAKFNDGKYITYINQKNPK